jgi:predicted ABC-type ATPase
LSGTSDPVLHVIAGPNGAGKTTFYLKVLGPVTHLDFVNADLVAADRWPDAQVEHAYDAAALAAEDRARRIAAGESFATETVFSHESKVALLRDAEAAGYRVVLHVVLIPEDLAVARVVDRVANGGHDVPEDKVRARFGRLWRHLREAIALVDEAHVYDNTTAAEPFRLVASYLHGQVIGSPGWPPWAPADLRATGRRTS